MPYLYLILLFFKIGKMLQNLLFAAVVIGALWANIYFVHVVIIILEITSGLIVHVRQEGPKALGRSPENVCS